MRFLRAALLLSLSPLLAAQAGEKSVPEKLGLESLYHPVQKVRYLPAPAAQWRWLPNGGLLETRFDAAAGKGGMSLLDAKTFQPKPLLDLERLTKALVESGVAEAESKAVVGRGAFTWNHGQSAFVASLQGDLYWVEVAKASVRRLTTAPGDEDEATFSPDNTKIAFLRGNDLHVVEVATARETPLTTGGDADHFHGRLDWVYQEEIYGRGNFKGFWWAPDSSKLAYLALDETKVPTFTLVDDRTQPQQLLQTRYPKAGEPNPVARLGVVDLQGRTTWMEDPHPGQETLVVKVGWDPKGRLLACLTNRVQTWLELRRYAGLKSALLLKEEGLAWQEADHHSLPVFLKDGSFLWESERTGHRHLYRFDGEGGLRGPLTAGTWEVRKLHGIDEKLGVAYFDATERSAIGSDLYRVELAAAHPNEGLTRLSEAPGTHRISFNPAFTAYLDTVSDIAMPPRTAVVDANGFVLRVLDEGSAPRYQGVKRGTVRFQQVPTRDGFHMETMLVLPPDFDPKKVYPVFHHIYGGPIAPLVSNSFSRRDPLWFHFLAQQGWVVWVCDNRSASNKGLASAQGVHRKFGQQELEDQLDGLAWLKKQGWADMDRVVMEGWSYGGYMTLYALTHSDAWKAGIAGAPVTDWRFYDSVYTERYMGTPQDNPLGYDASSPLKAARDLKGSLLLLHGTLDDNVHPQNSIQFIDALQKAGRNPELVLLPGATHSPHAPQHVWTQKKAMWDFLQKNR
jgi:dipeptidyl-peptidase-4